MENVTATAWSLVDGVGSFKNDSIGCSVNAASPAAGLEHLVVGGGSIPGFLLSIGVGSQGDVFLPPASEVYTRRDDLISVHEAEGTDAPWSVRTLLSWNVVPLRTVEGVLLTLTLSLQTDRLDVRPVIELRSSLGGEAVLAQDDATIAWLASDKQDKGPSCFVAPHPSDLSEATLMVKADECRLRFAPVFLEKGVIRRCRAAACFLTNSEQETSNDAALAAIAELAAQPLPLTT